MPDPDYITSPVKGQKTESALTELRSQIARREAVRWRPEYCQLLVAYAEKNQSFRATNNQVAEFIGCTVRAVFKWRKEHPEFEEAFQTAQQIVVDRCLEGLWESATGAMSTTQKTTTRPDGTTTTEVTIRKDPPNPQASMFLLKNLRPDEWKDRRDVDVMSVGEPIRPVILFSEQKKERPVIDVTPTEVEKHDE